MVGEGGGGTMKADFAAMWPEVKLCEQPLGAGRSKG